MVNNPDGIIPRMQKRYAGLLRWTLEHRGKSVMGILLIIAVSIVPMKLTKGDSGNEDDPTEIDIFYQWQGSYSKEEMGKVVNMVEQYVNTNRKRFGVERIYSRYSEQGWAVTEVDIATKDSKRAKEIEEELRKDMPASARANIGIRGEGGGQGVLADGGMEVDLVHRAPP